MKDNLKKVMFLVVGFFLFTTFTNCEKETLLLPENKKEINSAPADLQVLTDLNSIPELNDYVSGIVDQESTIVFRKSSITKAQKTLSSIDVINTTNVAWVDNGENLRYSFLVKDTEKATLLLVVDKDKQDDHLSSFYAKLNKKEGEYASYEYYAEKPSKSIINATSKRTNVEYDCVAPTTPGSGGGGSGGKDAPLPTPNKPRDPNPGLGGPTRPITFPTSPPPLPVTKPCTCGGGQDDDRQNRTIIEAELLEIGVTTNNNHGCPEGYLPVPIPGTEEPGDSFCPSNGSCDNAFEEFVQELLNNPPPAGANKFVYVNYEKMVAEALEFSGDDDAILIAEQFKFAAARESFLNSVEHHGITTSGKTILQIGKPVDLELNKLTERQQLVVAKQAAQVTVLSESTPNSSSNFWPQNREEWSAYLTVMAPLLFEVGIAFVPGSGVIDLFRSIESGDNVGVAVAVGGLVVDAAGGNTIRGAIKGARIYRKAAIITSKLGRATLKPAAKAASRGFKITTSGLRLVVKKGNKTIATGKEVVKRFLRISEKLENLPNARRLIDDGTEPNLLKRIDELSTTRLNELDDLYKPNNFKLPSNRPSRNGQRLNGDFTVERLPGGKLTRVRYNKNGFPNFINVRGFLGKGFVYKSNNLKGNATSTDFTKATDWLKRKFPNKNIIPKGTSVEIDGKLYTWHHHQDGKSMIPVLRTIHNAFRHSGGAAVIRRDLQCLFSSPF